MIIRAIMHTNKPINMPQQLISILYFISMLVPPAFISAQDVKHGCQERCGNLPIRYPFGVGSDCFLDPSFSITCNTSSSGLPKAYLSEIDKEVIEINQTYVRVKYPILVSVCYDEMNVAEAPYKQKTTVNLSGTAYTLSSINRLTAIGCDDVVLQSNGSRVVSGGCSAFCADNNIDEGGRGHCPNNVTSLGYGCCQAYIFADTVFLEAELVDLSGKLNRRKVFPCSHAFIQEGRNMNETVFSYPLHYLENYSSMAMALQSDHPVVRAVRLDWKVGTENCIRAQRNRSSYACKDEKSVCHDDDSDGYHSGSSDRRVKGYRCTCIYPYQGNAYLPGGCQSHSSSIPISKPECLNQCGELSIPFPFGIGLNCFLAPSFEISCNESTPYLSILNLEVIELNSSRVLINHSDPDQMGFACYDNSHSVLTRTENRSLVINLSTTSYTLSDENWITAIGCDDMVVGISKQPNSTTNIASGCAAVCWDRPIFLPDYAYCAMSSGPTTSYLPEDGCCRAPIPKGTTHLQATMLNLRGRRPRTNFSCGYTFVQYKTRDIYPIMDNSTTIKLNGLRILALDWRIGAQNCSEAQKSSAAFACKSNSDCVDFDATVGGYLCNCSQGYQGNPYLDPGCQDIDECDDNSNTTINPCNSNSKCINTIGSVDCLCPTGYFGDGRKDGQGCFKLPPSKSKIIWIGMGSGLGSLLLFLLCFWLYKMLQKRKQKMIKEKFFKRNGGLLLRQQTNEGALGKTKVFPVKELEVATDYFSENRIIGYGGQGTVYKGMLSNGKIVAVKKSKLVEENQVEQFINEVAILSQINHRNVVRLLGCCLETEVPLLVYEFMPNGTLFDLIHDPNKEFSFPWKMRLKIAADVAGALAYLHSASSMPIYHRDIKSSNILLDEKYVVKVSDFGTSRSVAADQTHLTTIVKGTFGYLDPEYFQSSQFTEKSDVYSFGVVLVELLTGQRPISFNERDEERSLATRFQTSMEANTLDAILDPQVSEQCKKEEVIVVARLAQRCLNLKGKMRPTMKEVATELESFRISQMSIGVKDEIEQVRGFENMPAMISDIEYTWTGSYKSVASSSSDTHPLIFTPK